MNQILTDAQDFAQSLRPKAVATGQPDDLKTDPHFEENPAISKVIEFAIKRRKNLLLVGPTGCGKSCYAIQVAARLKERLEIFSCTGETSNDELMAKPWVTTNDKGEAVTTVSYGAVLRAYKEGKGLLLEEVDMAVPDILAGLHRVMETNQNYYTCNTGVQEVVPKSKDFFVVATANTIGTGEDSFVYSGTKPLNQAFMNRFSLTVLMDYMDRPQEIKVLVNKTGIDKSLAEQMVDAARDARSARTTGADRIISTISTRDLLEWSDAIVGMSMGMIDAAWFTFLNRMTETDRDIVKTFIENRVR